MFNLGRLQFGAVKPNFYDKKLPPQLPLNLYKNAITKKSIKHNPPPIGNKAQNHSTKNIKFGNMNEYLKDAIKSSGTRKNIKLNINEAQFSKKNIKLGNINKYLKDAIKSSDKRKNIKLDLNKTPSSDTIIASSGTDHEDITTPDYLHINSEHNEILKKSKSPTFILHSDLHNRDLTYSIGKVVGNGYFGKVFVCEDSGCNTVALKIPTLKGEDYIEKRSSHEKAKKLPKKIIKIIKNTHYSDEEKQKLIMKSLILPEKKMNLYNKNTQNEINILNILMKDEKCHENILCMHDYGRIIVTNKNGIRRKQLYIIYEYLDDYETIRHSAHLLSKTQKEIIKAKIISAVDYIHSKGITHNDLNGCNIMYKIDKDTKNINIKIIDFGFAKNYSDRNKSVNFIRNIEKDKLRLSYEFKSL